MKPLASGFLLLPPSPIRGYEGVCRWGTEGPFQPDTEGADEAKVDAPGLDHMWQFQPPGWRQDAYRLYEENLSPNTGMEEELFDSLTLIHSCEIAARIRMMVEPHLGHHEIIHCVLYEVGVPVKPIQADPARQFLGYDVAYPGGDLFSAIAFGVFKVEFVNSEPDPALVANYAHLLNQHGLFESSQVTSAYLQDFKRGCESEADSDFFTYALTRYP